jgi:hypothetical protein
MPQEPEVVAKDEALRRAGRIYADEVIRIATERALAEAHKKAPAGQGEGEDQNPTTQGRDQP